ncbi:MAG: hypothetical protein K1X72_12150 [Pyrinomonadaceae bacterium]|nr:hypothetical protein [Pyrinomonadaceae bacterium]
MPIKLAILFSGLFLLIGMLTGVWKYTTIMKSEHAKSSMYVDIAHRNALLFSFACVVIAKLMEFSPFSMTIQIIITAIPLFYFSLTTINQIKEGFAGRTETIFKERNFSTTWFTYGLIVGEIGAISLMIIGYIYTQLL